MNDLLKINFDTEQPTVSARDLHEALGIRERFSLWFSRYADVFENGADYQEVGKPTVVNNGAKRVLDDYLMSTDMAKHISMMTKTEKGKIMRQYFIDLEKAWNTPEQIMARALKMANQSIESLKDRCKFLGDQVIEQQQIITELQPKANYVDTIFLDSLKYFLPCVRCYTVKLPNIIKTAQAFNGFNSHCLWCFADFNFFHVLHFLS